MIERRVAKLRASKSHLMPIVRVLVDAAALYSVMLFGFLICFLTASNGESVLSDMVNLLFTSFMENNTELCLTRPCLSYRSPSTWCLFALRSIVDITSRLPVLDERPRRWNKDTYSDIL